MVRIVGTLGPRSRTVQSISDCLNAGMSVARFDFSWGDAEYHQETLDNLKTSMKRTIKSCGVMLDTVGPEIQIVNKSQKPITLKKGNSVILTPDRGQEPSSEVFPISFAGLAKALRKGDTICVGEYLLMGSKTASVWVEVTEIQHDDVVCAIKNSTTLSGSLFTLHASQIHIDVPTLTNQDKQIISSWGVKNNIDFLSLSYTRNADDVREARDFLAKLGDLSPTRIFAKIENIEGLTHFDSILQEADGIILSLGDLGIDLPPHKVSLFQKSATYKCNMVGKPAVLTRVVDSMTNNLKPTRVQAYDVANVVFDGCGMILLGVETSGGLYPVETISTIAKICAEVEAFNVTELVNIKKYQQIHEPMLSFQFTTSNNVASEIDNEDSMRIENTRNVLVKWNVVILKFFEVLLDVLWAVIRLIDAFFDIFGVLFQIDNSF